MSYGKTPWYIWGSGVEDDHSDSTLHIEGPGLLAGPRSVDGGATHDVEAVAIPHGAMMLFLNDMLRRYPMHATVGDVLREMKEEGDYR